MSKKYYIIPIFVPHKGCPHDCIFCNQKKITGTMVDITPEDVNNQILEYMKTIDRDNSYVEISFFGGSFTGIPMDYQSCLLEPAYEALKEGTIDNIRLSTRPDYISDEILKNLKKYHVGVIELGVQSMDDKVLEIAERGHTRLDVIAASKLIREYDFSLGLQMMVGLPGDTVEKDLYTVDEIIKLEPDFVRIYPALVIKNTYMEYMYNNNLYSPLTLDKCIDICKKLYIKFTLHNVKIIRIGLQATENINIGKDIVAGPFHPSIREHVESSLLNDMLDYMLVKEFLNSDKITILVNPKYISRLYADRKTYYNKVLEKHNHLKLFVQQDSSLKDMTLMVSDGYIKRKMSIYEFINLVN